MLIPQEPFEIGYYGVTIKITPFTDGLNMRYLVSLPTRKVTIEACLNDNQPGMWQEIPGGSTELAEAIGALIEERDL